MSLILEEKESTQSILTKEKTGNKCLDQNDDIVFMSKGKAQVKSCNLFFLHKNQRFQKSYCHGNKMSKGIYTSVCFNAVLTKSEFG